MTHAPENSVIQPWICSLWTTSHPVIEYNGHLLFTVDSNITYENGLVETEFSTLDKIHFNGFNICSKTFCQNYRYDDSWVCKNDRFYNIRKILSDKLNNPYFLGELLDVDRIHDNLYKYEETKNFSIVKIDTSIQQCISMRIKCDNNVLRFIAKCKAITQTD